MEIVLPIDGFNGQTGTIPRQEKSASVLEDDTQMKILPVEKTELEMRHDSRLDTRPFALLASAEFSNAMAKGSKTVSRQRG